MIKKELLTIEFKRTRDARSNYVEKAITVAQEQYTSLLTGLQAVGQVQGWKVQQLVFAGGTCGSVHVESFKMIVLLLFLQKQSLAFAVYLFGIGTLHTGPGLKQKTHVIMLSP